MSKSTQYRPTLVQCSVCSRSVAVVKVQINAMDSNKGSFLGCGPPSYDESDDLENAKCESSKPSVNVLALKNMPPVTHLHDDGSLNFPVVLVPLCLEDFEYVGCASAHTCSKENQK